MTTVLDEVRETVDKTIHKLEQTKFIVDPIAGDSLSRITSIVSSAYKRHGAIIEIALFHAIKQQNTIEAHSKYPFFISKNTSSYVEGHDYTSDEGITACLKTSMPYREEGSKYEIDIIYFDHATNTVCALEVKRGNGQFDRGKRDSMIKAALSVRALLKNFAELKGWPAKKVESRILAYYGVPKFPPPIYLKGKEINHFIGPGIYEKVEAVNNYFRERLLDVVSGDVEQRDLFH